MRLSALNVVELVQEVFIKLMPEDEESTTGLSMQGAVSGIRHLTTQQQASSIYEFATTHLLSKQPTR
jgi:hypothetical protein